MSGFEGMSRAGLLVRGVLGEPPAAERLAALRAEPLLVSIAPQLADSRRGQIMLATALNVLGRLFDYVSAIDLDVPAGVRVLPGIFGFRSRTELRREVLVLLRALRPADRPLDVRPGATRAPYARALAIGEPTAPPAREIIYIDGDGWVACAGPTPAGLVARPTWGLRSSSWSPRGVGMKCGTSAATRAERITKITSMPTTTARKASPSTSKIIPSC